MKRRWQVRCLSHWSYTSTERSCTLEFVPADLGQFVNNFTEWIVADVATDQTVQTVWPSLLQSKAVREMKLHRCLNCHLFTHLTNVAANRILINRDLFVRKLSRRWTKFSFVFVFRMKAIFNLFTRIRIIRQSQKFFFQLRWNIPSAHHVFRIHKVRTRSLGTRQMQFASLSSRWTTTAGLRVGKEDVSTICRRSRTRNRSQNSVRTELHPLDSSPTAIFAFRTFQREQERLLEAKTGKMKRELDLFLE